MTKPDDTIRVLIPLNLKTAVTPQWQGLSGGFEGGLSALPADMWGQDHDILEARHRLYSEARQRNLRRWSGNTRNWTPVAAVTLNPSAKQSSRGSSGQLTKIGKPREEEATSILTRTGNSDTICQRPSTSHSQPHSTEPQTYLSLFVSVQNDG